MPPGAIGWVFERIAAIGGAEDGPAQPQDAGDVAGSQRPGPAGIQQAVEAVLEADDLHSGVPPRLDDRPDHRVEARGVPAAGQHPDSGRSLEP